MKVHKMLCHCKNAPYMSDGVYQMEDKTVTKNKIKHLIKTVGYYYWYYYYYP